MDKMPVKFLKSHRSYVKGDVAGFSEGEAAKLIKAGVAKAYDPDEVETVTVSAEIDTEQAREFVRELKEKAGALDQREAEVRDREEHLVRAEEEISKRDGQIAELKEKLAAAEKSSLPNQGTKSNTAK